MLTLTYFGAGEVNNHSQPDGKSGVTGDATGATSVHIIASDKANLDDSKAKVFDENALLAVNDMGAAGKTWTLAGMAYADGRIYGRTLKEVFCIGSK